MSFLARLRATKSRIATIDAAKAAPPPSPLKPVDLTDPVQVTGVMDLAARIGDILLSAGTGNNDVKAQIHTVCTAYGLHYCHVDITFNTITVFAHIHTDTHTPINVFRVVRRMTLDFSKLQEVDRLIRSIRAGATDPATADKVLDDIMAAPPPYGLFMSLMGWSLMQAAVAVLLGGNMGVAAVSYVSSMLIMGGFVILGKQQLPMFFQNLYGGFIATLPAALTYHWAIKNGVNLPPSMVIAAGIVVMLAGLTLVQALQDGITGAPVTASARFFDTLLMTGAIVAGVALGIQAAAWLGVTLPPLETLPTLSASALVKVVSGAVASAAFAVACYAEWSSVVVSGCTALVGSGFYYFVFQPLGMGPVVGIALSATIIGLAGGLLARRFLIPPLITAVAGVTPLLPGLAIYRGMYAILHDQMLVGLTNLFLAMAIGAALAGGVVLGEWIARRLRRPPSLNKYLSFRRKTPAGNPWTKRQRT